VHAAQATAETTLSRVWLESASGDQWKTDVVKGDFGPEASDRDSIFACAPRKMRSRLSLNFTRPSIEQPYYDYQNRVALALVAPSAGGVGGVIFDGLPIHLSQTVQTLQRVQGQGDSTSRWW